ncbi:malto-oligosyltrehalose synthase [Candidimonas sp. SYP-B2681]|uniref:malto-oligosyltrehalose synthase n=1 Tax=Candidimonas sp. SYP-B2681 TaxID=2497686 RepID=UPI000F885CF0|nr:malto-oligosyltrehalose synthase [Candidimonas sp. SYP-B2681]RTZ45625.1 malto-oligosyltrehalose synthase [Candidimonas sp. SYP-B2681]
MSSLCSTARLQLHAGFTLHDACDQIPYYAKLGISHFYTSPISRARPGSMHGYDVVDHSIVSPELGGESALRALAQGLRARGMGIILDIVPNHMATHADNAWWWDVLQNGRDSAYASWFDIDWQSTRPGLAGKVLAPFLADHYGHSLARGELQLYFDDASQAFQIDACGTRFPVAPDSLSTEGMNPPEVLAQHDSTSPEGQCRMHELLERQHYRLTWWRCAADSINWRRFFEVSELIGVKVERQEVFDAVHALPLRLFSEGLVDGLRIDHVDGLAEPIAYCSQLYEALKKVAGLRPGPLRDNEPWLLVEKILAEGETLDDRWRVDGTSGYDFMDQAAAVLHDPAAEAAMTEHWEALTGDLRQPRALVHDARSLMLQRHFVAEREGLLQALSQLAGVNPSTRDWTREAIARVLDKILILFPVYRTYAGVSGRHEADALCLDRVMAEVRTRLDRDSGSDAVLCGLLQQWLGGERVVTDVATANSASQWQGEAIRRFQQLTPPLAAKSLEDTVFYRYGRLISRNEVGSDPSVLAITPETFHNRNLWRASWAPRSMLATATHDHKRGEDVRARLAVLSEIPYLWTAFSQRWMQWPLPISPAITAAQAGERYMLFQTLVGAWPLDLSVDNSDGMQNYADRIVQWQTKALREAKVSSSWFEPNLPYEEASNDFVYGLLPGGACHELARDIAGFVRQIAPAGAVNSLAQTVLRIAIPGVPDFYQGTDFWDFSLVDPDNRRPVDYAARVAALDADESIASLVANWKNGHIKQAVVSRGLELRRDQIDVFALGDYFALPVLGLRSNHVLAFLRTWQDRGVFILVPRLCYAGVSSHHTQGIPLIDPLFWGNTGVVLPRRYIGAQLHDALRGTDIRCPSDGLLRMADVFAELPVAVLVPG